MTLVPARVAYLAAGLLLAPVAARAACPSRGEDLASYAGAAQAAFAPPRDFDRVEALAAEVPGLVDCLAEPVLPAQAASAHTTVALGAFLAQSRELSLGALQAARAADPTRRLPEGMVPVGHPLQVAFAEAANRPVETAPVRPAQGLVVVVDGLPGAPRPTNRPALLQAVRDGTVEHSTYLLPEAALPAWADAPAEPVVALVEPTVAPARGRRGPSTGLLVAAGGMALASGGLWTAAVLDKASLEDGYDTVNGRIAEGLYDEDDRDEAQDVLDGQANRVNALGFAAQGATAATGLLLVGAFVF